MDWGEGDITVMSMCLCTFPPANLYLTQITRGHVFKTEVHTSV